MKQTPIKVAFVLFDDFTDLDFFLGWDVLNRVRTLCLDSSFEVEIAGTKSTHRSKAGLEIKTTCGISETANCNAVLFASGPKSKELCKDRSYLDLFHLNPETQLIGSMCSGALILGGLGLLRGKCATTYPTAVAMLESFNVTVVKKPFIVEGNVATAAACLAGRDLACWVIERLRGKKIAQLIDQSIQLIQE